jgi:NAD(P)H-dependent flavin oxidoreductase YrpB (nitropropane dioxygenase family)
MKTALCHMLGIEHPVIAAPMGPDLTGPEFVSAISNAGGLGVLQAQLSPPAVFRQAIRRVRELTDKPFGVNLILHFRVEEHVSAWKNASPCSRCSGATLHRMWSTPIPPE